MDKKTFTPGPWFAFRNWPRDSGPVLITTDDDHDGGEDGSEGVIASLGSDECTEQDDVNAALIAAAPEMYEALTRVKERMEEYDMDKDTAHDPDRELFELVKAAHQKALGESNGGWHG